MKILLFNAPPRSGKDTAADLLRAHGYIKFSLAAPLKKMVLQIYGMGHYNPDSLYKDVPFPEFHGKTFREVCIAHGQYMKRLHGDDFWVDKTLEAIRGHQARYRDADYVIPDVGFPAELKRLAQVFDDCTLIKLHRDGCNYDGDSRSDLAEIIETIHIDNNGTIDDLHMRLKTLFCKEKSDGKIAIGQV